MPADEVKKPGSLTKYFSEASHRCDELKPDPIAVDRDLICLIGKITLEDAKTFLSLNINENMTLVITSDGGSVDSAIDIANVMFDKKLDLVVNKACFSSCANYLFPAARYKFFMPNSWLGWHGAPARTLTDANPDYSRLLEKQDIFFKKIGVSINLIEDYPKNIDAKSVGEGKAFWIWSVENLKKKYHVEGVLSPYMPYSSHDDPRR